jgi:hypothetical protein
VLPFSKADPPPTRQDPIMELFVDRDLIASDVIQ